MEMTDGLNSLRLLRESLLLHDEIAYWEFLPPWERKE